ncbi:MAG: bile acid:sodium symporter, partial [Sphingomonadales bacterium]
MRRLLPDPFIAALLACVALASLLPARGGFASAVDVAATAAIVLLFFLHGLRLPREAVVQGLRHWRLHLTILATTFLLFPMLGVGVAALAPGLLPPALWLGVLFLCVLPSTVQSSIAFTSIAGGNVAGAVAAATASNLIGIALTPLLLRLVSEVHGAGVPLSGIWTIVLELLLPFAVGHLLRPWLGAFAARHKRLLALT